LRWGYEQGDFRARVSLRPGHVERPRAKRSVPAEGWTARTRERSVPAEGWTARTRETPFRATPAGGAELALGRWRRSVDHGGELHDPAGTGPRPSALGAPRIRERTCSRPARRGGAQGDAPEAVDQEWPPRRRSGLLRAVLGSHARGASGARRAGVQP